MLSSSLMDMIREKYADKTGELLIPPPVFDEMAGEFVALDLDKRTLSTRFPVQTKYFNPYRAVQGGIIAAAVDNTLGPLSMLVAPPSVTRRLEMKYSRQVGVESEYISVVGRLVEQKERNLIFSAEVRDSKGNLMARARSSHWIVETPG